MGAFRLSRRAGADLYDIGLYALRIWGETQTARYISQLEACCQPLAGNPGLGCPCDDVRRQLRRLEAGKHVLFYREEPGGILVSRILHERMLPENLTIDEEEDAAGSD